jgi:hypothetical protein
LAPGDVVEIEGKRGAVEKFSLRGVWLKDAEGRTHFFANRGVHNVSLISRRAETATPPPAFDPLQPKVNNANSADENKTGGVKG